MSAPPASTADFRTKYPEFRGVADETIATYLADSLLELDNCVWGRKLALGQMALTAHNLALTPFGQNARMMIKQANGEYTSVYEVAYRRMQREVTSGGRVV